MAKAKAGGSISSVAKELDISDTLLRIWVQKAGGGAPKSKPNGVKPSVRAARNHDLSAEIARLRSELKRTFTTQRDLTERIAILLTKDITDKAQAEALGMKEARRR